MVKLQRDWFSVPLGPTPTFYTLVWHQVKPTNGLDYALILTPCADYKNVGRVLGRFQIGERVGRVLAGRASLGAVVLCGTAFTNNVQMPPMPVVRVLLAPVPPNLIQTLASGRAIQSVRISNLRAIPLSLDLTLRSGTCKLYLGTHAMSLPVTYLYVKS